MITKEDKLQFEATFGVSIDKFKSVLNIVLPLEQTGIDIVAFDKWIGTPDNVSCAQYVESKYGKDAKVLVERVL